jgi:ATP-binding cassette, subfamily B, bacterial
MTESPEQDGQTRKVLSNGQVLAFVARQWMRRPRWFALSAGLMLLAVLCDLTAPWMADGLITAVSRPPELGTGQAWRAWGAFAGIYVVLLFFRNAGFLTWNPFASRNMEALVGEAFRRVQSFSADWHADTFAGATVRRVGRAMWGYDTVSDQIVLWLGPSTLVLFGLSISMLLHWPVVGAFALAMVVAYMAVSLSMAQLWIRPANLKSAAMDSEIGAVLADSITSNATVKAFGAETREADRFAATARAWRLAATKSWNRAVLTGTTLNVLTLILQAGLTGLLVRLWSRHQAQAGDVAFAITAFMLMTGYLRNFGENVRNLQKGLDDSEAVASYMRMAPQVADRAGADAFRRGKGEVVFDQVTFQYKGQDEALYDRFSLTIKAGERVALVGPTGSGKSTFVKLIQRLYDLQDGQIRIDGQDVASVTQESLRQAIAVVPQDPALFHRSIRENIAYGRPDATQDEVIAAARKAKAHGFISKLPKGYDTLVGERGVKLSGGERQRVAIARAFLTGAPIVIFDEATSSLDVETERDVQLASDALMKGRTTIVIAHRLSTIRGADRILVFADGRVVEEGRHNDLVQKKGVYARLHAVTEGAI